MPATPDKYRNFAELKGSETAAAWGIVSQLRGTGVAIIAPHGGGIERGTSEVASAIAGEDLTFYAFEGRKTQSNTDLHITSSNFDEPDGRATIQSANTVVAIHGAAGKTPAVYVGGLDEELATVIGERLVQADFDAQKHPRLQGASPDNICNRGKFGRGVQLELTMALRESFFQNMTTAGRQQQTAAFKSFVSAVRGALGLD